MADWPPAPPAPALSRSCLCIPRQPMGLVTGFGSRKEKINSLCPARCCSFPTAVTILSLFPGKQMTEETTPFEVRSSLKKKSPESQGGHQAASSVAMEANQQDSPRPLLPAPPDAVPAHQSGTLLCAAERWSFPKDSTAAGSKIRLGPKTHSKMLSDGKGWEISNGDGQRYWQQSPEKRPALLTLTLLRAKSQAFWV